MNAAPIRVLLVDDSAVIRRFVTAALEEAPDIVVSATASNGAIAIERLARDVPDVVVLDVEMPVLDGLATLRQLRPRWPDVPVVMYSTLTQRGAAATLDALSLGATDYVLKPSSIGEGGTALDSVRRELASVVRSWGNLYRARNAVTRRLAPLGVPTGPAPGPVRPATPARPKSRSGLAEVLVVGSSTGGPHALTELIPQLPATLSVPVLLVQHMPALFTKLLAERLDARSAINVVEAEPGMVVEPGRVYIAPGGIHMVVRREGMVVRIAEDDGPPECSCKPAVDVLFRSAVEVWGGRVLAVVLTGMGQDGLVGSRAISAAGGTIAVQDEATSVVWGMPGAVSRDGLADAELPLGRVAPYLIRVLTPTLSGARS